MKKIISGITLLATFSLMAVDWSAWRGEKRNGTTSETIKIEALSEIPLWEAEVGNGYSAVSVYHGRLLTAGNKNGQDTIYCLDAASGGEIWTYSYLCAAAGTYPGPCATPVTDGENVYMLSREGDIICLALGSGKLKWTRKKHGSDEVRKLTWGFASSILLHDGMAIVNMGGKGMALSAADGTPIWQSSGTGNYASPVIFSLKGKDYLAIFSVRSLLILEPRTGNEIASYPWETKYDVNAIDPIIAEDGSKIFISSSNDHGSALLNFDGKSLNKIWENKNLCSLLTIPILVDGIIFGVTGAGGAPRGNFCAIKLSDGSLCWKSKIQFGSFVQAGNIFVYLEDNGTINLIKPSAIKCEVQKTVKYPKLGVAKCWTMPVVAEGRIYCRNANGRLFCIAAQ